MNDYRIPNRTHKSVELVDSLIKSIQSEDVLHSCWRLKLPKNQLDQLHCTVGQINIQDVLLDFAVNSSLEQLVNVSKRGDNILYMVLSNVPTPIAQVKVHSAAVITVKSTL